MGGLAANDIAVLRIALVAETLEAAFYNYVVGNNTLFNTFPAMAKQYVPLIQAHENAHKEAITALLGPENHFTCNSFPYAAAVTDYPSFLTLALGFENLGVSAYDYAAAGLSNPILLQIAATIATIEGRHAAFLSVLQGHNFVNFTAALTKNVTVGVTAEGFDSANSPAKVASVVEALNLLTDCSAAQVQAVLDAIAGYKQAPQPKNYDTKKLRSTTLSGKPVDLTLAQNDVAVLMYASVLEALESTFYKQVVANFSEPAFVAAGFPHGTYAYMKVIAAHEKSHYAFLAGVLGDKVPTPCAYYSWATHTGPLTVQEVVMLANVFETTGVSAYDGAIDGISMPGYASAAATIATVEARHSSYLRSLTAYLPVATDMTPILTAMAFDETFTPAEVVGKIKPFLAGCTDPANLPADLPASRTNKVKGRR